MIANRLLASVGLLPLVAAVAVGQSFAPPPPRTVPGSYQPPVREPSGWTPPAASMGGVRKASATDAEFPPLSLPTVPGGPQPGPTAVDTLTAPPIPPAVPNPVPGAIYSPWCGDQPAGGGCCGPVGANGPVTFEPYFRTGPSFTFGGAGLADALKTFAWTFSGGTRTLLFDPSGESAWVIDLGFSHTTQRGIGAAHPVTVNIDAVKFGGPGVPGATTFDAGVTHLRRTSFNYGIGRDRFLVGPGVSGDGNCYGNLRVGWDVGGRWGTGSVDLEPTLDPDGYRRRQKVYQGIYGAGQITWERPMGAFTPFIGGRVEYGYTWTDLLPPNNADLQDVNLLLTVGFRF